MQENNKKNWLTIVIIITVLITAIAVYMNQAPLPAYIDEAPSPSPTTKPELPELVEYREEAHQISIQVPKAWSQIIKNGNKTFIDTDGSFLSLQISNYNPQINMVTEQSINNESLAAGGHCILFNKLTTSSYLVIYQMGEVITSEYVVWDRGTEIRLIFSTSDDLYGQYTDLISYICETMKWKPSDIISKSIYLYYNDFGSFEFGVPAGWDAGISGESFAAVSPQTGSVYTVSVGQTDRTSLKELSQIQYSQEMGSTHTNYFLKSFVSSETQITAESVYNLNDAQMVLYHIIMISDGYQFSFTLDAPADGGSNDFQIIQDCLKYFRKFKNPA